MKSRSLLIGVVLVVVAVAIGVATLVRGGSDRGEAVRVALVEKRTITSRVLAQGKVRARTQVEVASEVAGRVANVMIEVGDVVKAGDALFSLDGEQLRNAVEQIGAAQSAAAAMEKKAELALLEARRSLERDQKLRDKGVVSDDQIKLAESRVALSEADTAQAKANGERTRVDLQRARDALRRAKVVAPSAGTVVAVGIEEGQVVSAVTGLSASPDASLGLGIGGTSAPVIIADLDELLLKLDVDELDVGQVHPGQKAIIKAQGLKDVEFEGTVERVGLMGRDVMGAVLFTVEVKVERSVAPRNGSLARGAGTDELAQPALPSPREVLRPGMSASADIEVQTIDSTLSVPVAAVVEASTNDEGEVPDHVFVVDGGKDAMRVRLVAVKLGPSEGDAIAILHGLEEGKTVVAGPFRVLRSLEDGDKVRLEKKSDKADEARGKKEKP